RGAVQRTQRRQNEMQNGKIRNRWRDGKPAKRLLVLASIVAGATTLGSSAALAQVPSALLPRNLSPWGMFLSADVVVKAVMIGLAFASLVTWTVWLSKTIELQRETRRAKRRLGMLEQGGTLREAARVCGAGNDAVAQLVLSAAREAE